MFQTNIVEKIKTHILYSVTFLKKNRAVYEIMWKNVVERGRPQMKIWRMRVACWIIKATDTHSEYVVLVSFPLQQQLSERAGMLHYTNVACLCCVTLTLSFESLWLKFAISFPLQALINTSSFLLFVETRKRAVELLLHLFI